MTPLRLALSVAALAAAFCSTSLAEDAAVPENMWVYFGTYTRGSDGGGVHVATFNTKTGELGEPKLAGTTVNPSFVAIHPDGEHLYTVGEVSNRGGKMEGGVTAFSLDKKTGLLTELNAKSSGGAGPCHLICDGKNVLVANYGGGSVTVLPLKRDGGLRDASSFHQHAGTVADPKRQGGAHGHSVNLDPAGEHAIVADLGLDKLLVYDYDAEAGTLTANAPPAFTTPPRSGPRHFAFHPNGKFAYTNLEITLEVIALRYDAATGEFTQVGIHSTLPKGGDTSGSTAETRVHPNGKFVYVSNRGHDSIARFKVNQETGDLTPLGHTPTGGQTPRNFNLDPSGRWLLAANQATGNVVVFAVNPDTGDLTPTGREIKVPSPVCVRFTAAE